MRSRFLNADRLRSSVIQGLWYVGNAPRAQLAVSWGLLLLGLVLWTAAQSYLTVAPLQNRALPPEVDDTLTYLVKTEQMEECFFQDCPALEDLRKQVLDLDSNPEAAAQQKLASSRIFPFYHPLFSLILLGLKQFGLDLMGAFKAVWYVAPFLFGFGFAYLLAAMWGLPAAGVALILLAPKVFPDTGLNLVVPSTIAMAMACFVWARIVSRDGDAPWTLILGSIALVAMHPIGRIYALMAGLFVVLISASPSSRRTWLPVLGTVLIVAVAFLVPLFVHRPLMFTPTLVHDGQNPLMSALVGFGQSALTVWTGIIRLEGGLFGSVPLFCAVVAFGFLALEPGRRRIVGRITLAYVFIFLAIHLYVSDHPADVVLRMWIPLIVILFGAVGKAIEYAFRRSWRLFIGHYTDRGATGDLDVSKGWPVVVFALLLGYSFYMLVLGGEQVQATRQYLMEREPLRFVQSQPELLMSQAKPGDRVLYTSIMIMPYYFIHGAMQLGAVYYHPALKGTPTETEWLNRPDLHYAVTYNPTVYHPSFEGVDENRWWITSPQFRYSPLSTPFTAEPVSREGWIPTAEYRWIDVSTNDRDIPDRLRILIKNKGARTKMEMIPIGPDGHLITRARVEVPIPAERSGWISLDLSKAPGARRFRIMPPKGAHRILIGGIVFGDDPLHWPWAQKAELIVQPKDSSSSPIVLSFDPAKILPEPVNRRKITVLDDKGSSVLFKID